MEQFKEFKYFSAAEVALWLAAQGLGTHIQKFLEEGVDGDLLSRLTVEDLTGDLGLSSLHAKKIRKNIEFTQNLSADTAILNKKIEALSRENEGLLEKVAALEDALKVKPLEELGEAEVAIQEDVAVNLQGDTVEGEAQLSHKELQESKQYCLPQFLHDEGTYRRVPPGWKFPSLPLRPMYTYWHCGDVEKDYPPMKFLERKDIAHISKRAPQQLSEIKRVMTLIDNRAMSKGMQLKGIMTPDEANLLFARGEEAIMEIVSSETNTGRKRKFHRLKPRTIVSILFKKRRQLREEEKLVSDQVSDSVAPENCETE